MYKPTNQLPNQICETTNVVNQPTIGFSTNIVNPEEEFEHDKTVAGHPVDRFQREPINERYQPTNQIYKPTNQPTVSSIQPTSHPTNHPTNQPPNGVSPEELGHSANRFPSESVNQNY